MPYQITWEGQGLVCRFNGACSGRDVLTAFEEIGASPRFDALRYQILDYLDIERQDVTEAQVDEVAALNFAHHYTNPRVVYASVAVDPAVTSLIEHYIRVNHHPHRQHCCRSVAEAREWIRTQTT